MKTLFVCAAAFAAAAGGEDLTPEWRTTAAARIDAIRKASLTVAVKDTLGRAIRDAQVRVRMRRHEFGFGSAVAAGPLLAKGPEYERYREVVRTWFNQAVLENDLKWPQWERDRTRALDALAWLRENGIDKVRGHTLVWPGWRWLPADLQAIAGDPAAVRKRIMDHIQDELTATRGQLAEWDVLNEPYTNSELQKIAGDEEMAAWFHQAREYEPNAVLYINDFGILSGGGRDRSHQDHYYATIYKLLEQGAPVGGIGMQGHFGAELTPVPRVWEILDRFAQFGKKIQITEFDIDIDDEVAQAQYTRDFMTAVFAHPSVDGFMMWGFWEGRHWRPRGAMFRRDWSMKPNGQAYHDLVFEQWWTDATGRTGSDGSFAVRGFRGEYEVEVTWEGRRMVRRAMLGRDGAVVYIVL